MSAIDVTEEAPASRTRSPVLAEEVVIRPPERRELGACRMILPEVFRMGASPALLLALRPRPLGFLGVLAHEQVRGGEHPEWRAWLHVVRGFRRRGIGTRLVHGLIRRAEARGIRHLSVPLLPDDPGHARFLNSLGFRPTAGITFHEVGLDRHRAAIQPLYDRLRAGEKIPPGASVLPLRDAPWEGLERLLAEFTACTPPPRANRWPDVWRRRSVQRASIVLMLDGQVIGAGLAEADGTCAEVLWRIVAPEYRGGWANIMLIAEGGNHAARNGVERLRFTTTSTTTDTLRFAAIHGVDQSRTVAVHSLLIDRPTS